MTQITDNLNTITVLDTNIYNVEQLTMFVEGDIRLRANFQQYVTGMIEANQAAVMVAYCTEMATEYEGKELNKRLTVIRKQIERACKALDMDKYTIKMVDGRYQFVLATKQATPADDINPDNDGDNGENGDNGESNKGAVHEEASRLMAIFLNNRTLDNAAKVTDFMLNLVS